MDDLYRSLNGRWLDTHEIPADRASDGNFHQLRDQAEEQVHAIVREGDGLACALYRSFMDESAIPGVEALADDFSLVDVASVADFLRGAGQLDRVGVGGPVACYVAKSAADEQVVLYVYQSGLGLPDEAYYREASHAPVLEAYRAHIARMLPFAKEFLAGEWASAERELAGNADGAAEHNDFTENNGATKNNDAAVAAVLADRIIALETDLARGHVDVVAARDAEARFNPGTVADLPGSAQALLLAMGAQADWPINNAMPKYLKHLDGLLTEERLPDFILAAKWNILASRAGLLRDEISKANFEFFGTQLTGATQQRDRWKRAVGLAENLVGFSIGKEFVQRHFPAASKIAMDGLVEQLLDAYRQRISQLGWMTEATREKALVKLGSFKAKIGYPETWIDYEGLEFSPSGADVVANVRAGSEWNHDYSLSKVGKPADRDEWVTTPQTVNAFYNPVVNDITFPAAILQPPFFDVDADPAANFGAIGAVIGHEIGHGFDDQGSKYDEVGNLNSWWSDEDRAAFESLTEVLVEQFDGLVPSALQGSAGAAGAEGTDAASAGVNGRFTLGENIGDLGGLGIAVVAYRNLMEERGEQPNYVELFNSWARVWRNKVRPEMAAQLLAMDPHSPAEFRCNVIAANIPEFYEAFPETDESSPMWIDPERRLTIW